MYFFRMNLVLKAYERIQKLVLNHRRLSPGDGPSDRTYLQLPNVNLRTLKMWYVCGVINVYYI